MDIGLRGTALILAFAVAFTAAATDLFRGIIPNRLTYPAILAGLGLGFLSGDLQGLVFAAVGLAIAGVPFLLAFLFQGGGGGDVKLMAALGALIGYPAILMPLVASVIVGGAMATATLLLGRQIKSITMRYLPGVARSPSLAEAGSICHRSSIPFGVAAAIGLAWAHVPGLWLPLSYLLPLGGP